MQGRWHVPYAGQSPAVFPPPVTAGNGQNWQPECVVPHSGHHMNVQQQRWQQQEAMPSWQHDAHADLPPCSSYDSYQAPANQLHCSGGCGEVHFPVSCLPVQQGAVPSERDIRSHETQNQHLISGQPMFQNVTARQSHPYFQGPALAGNSGPSDIQLVSYGGSQPGRMHTVGNHSSAGPPACDYQNNQHQGAPHHYFASPHDQVSLQSPPPAYPCCSSNAISQPFAATTMAPPMEVAPPLPDEPPAPDEEPPPLPPDIIDATDLFNNPGRKSRPSRIAIILRGAPGSGKSWAATKLRGIEVQNGGDPPRIHSLDAYFMQESEETVVDERGRKRKVTSEVYEYEAEMEERYTDDLIKSFRRTVEDRNYAVVIVDAPNGMIRRLSEMWDAGQKGGYEVYIAESLEQDPKQCFEQNKHGRTLQHVHDFLTSMEKCPNMYPQLDLKPLLISPDSVARPFHPDVCRSRGIREIEMEVETTAVLQNQHRQPKRRRLTVEPGKGDSDKAGNKTKWDSFDDGTQ